MSSINIGRNILALRALGKLSETTAQLSTATERLSSGLRINRASDDAAGLAIASSLNLDTRVLTQGVRNLNDGVSLLNVAEGAIHELTAITTRQKELAEQAANGVYSAKQRQALNTEAHALTEEFNRIVATTKFNGVKVLDRNANNPLRLQGGYGTQGGISVKVGLASGDDTTVASGRFGSASSFGDAGGSFSPVAGDVNGDGIMDMVVSNYTANSIGVLLGNGDGSFGAVETFSAGTTNNYAGTLGDFNNDGKLDVAVTQSGDGSVNVLLGNGDGTFQRRKNVSGPQSGSGRSIQTGDFNHDGNLDIVFGDSSYAGYILGNGDGTFQAAVTVASNAHSVTVGDFNGDGNLDFVAGFSTMDLYVGDGHGGFTNVASVGSATFYSISSGDVNGDGKLDLVGADYGNGDFQVILGNGDGTFASPITVASGGNTTRAMTVRDLNGDGFADLLATHRSNDTIGVVLSNGDGTFQTPRNIRSGTDPTGVAVADLNGDGILDIFGVSYDSSTVDPALGEVGNSAYTPEINLLSQAAARASITSLSTRLDSLASALGEIGSGQSRLAVAINTLNATIDNTQAAASRIQDADIAAEAGKMLRLQILQKAGASVLAQANLEPNLALKLLRSG